MLIFNVPAVANTYLPVRSVSIRALLEIEPVQVRFSLHPLPNEIDRAKGAAEIELFNLVTAAITRASQGGKGRPDDEADREAALKAFPAYQGKANVQ